MVESIKCSKYEKFNKSKSEMQFLILFLFWRRRTFLFIWDSKPIFRLVKNIQDLQAGSKILESFQI